MAPITTIIIIGLVALSVALFVSGNYRANKLDEIYCNSLKKVGDLYQNLDKARDEKYNTLLRDYHRLQAENAILKVTKSIIKEPKVSTFKDLKFPHNDGLDTTDY